MQTTTIQPKITLFENDQLFIQCNSLAEVKVALQMYWHTDDWTGAYYRIKDGEWKFTMNPYAISRDAHEVVIWFSHNETLQDISDVHILLNADTCQVEEYNCSNMICPPTNLKELLARGIYEDEDWAVKPKNVTVMD